MTNIPLEYSVKNKHVTIIYRPIGIARTTLWLDHSLSCM